MLENIPLSTFCIILGQEWRTLLMTVKEKETKCSKRNARGLELERKRF